MHILHQTHYKAHKSIFMNTLHNKKQLKAIINAGNKLIKFQHVWTLNKCCYKLIDFDQYAAPKNNYIHKPDLMEINIISAKANLYLFNHMTRIYGVLINTFLTN